MPCKFCGALSVCTYNLVKFVRKEVFMQAKLTLSIEKSVIDKAKDFARRNHTSLSQMIEDYFAKITEKEKKDDDELSPIIKELSGVLKLPKDFDHKKDRLEYLEKKYGV